MTKPEENKNQVLTLGCRLNAYESEIMAQSLARQGRENVIIVNSCAVTNEAVRQTRQTIRKARRNHPQAKIIVTGCAAEIDPDHFLNLPEVDQVIGNGDKLKDGVYAPYNQDKRLIQTDIFEQEEAPFARQSLNHFGGRTRAFLEVQKGCDHRCTFCIIPYGRGPSRSLPPGKVVEEVKKLCANGMKEVVLCGVDMTAYGRDLPFDEGLGSLVKKILHHVPELSRLRLSSVDSSEIDDQLMELFANENRLMPHLHLSLQSGDAMILKRMKRRHSPEQALDLVGKLRQYRPDIVFGADIIAGFPTESDEMFENTLNHLVQCDITWLHIFPFSAKKGTPAERIGNQVSRQTIKARAKILRDFAKLQEQKYLQSINGRQELVLIEDGLNGYSPGYAPIMLDQPHPQQGQLIQVTYQKVIEDKGRFKLLAKSHEFQDKKQEQLCAG